VIAFKKTILLFVAPDFAHQKNRVDHHSRDQQSKKNNASTSGTTCRQ